MPHTAVLPLQHMQPASGRLRHICLLTICCKLDYFLPLASPVCVLQVVHSRTFGAPGRQGSVGVRMLVPLVDMLNHAGDYITSPPGSSSAGAPPAVQAYDNVRCCGSLLCFMLASSLAPPPPLRCVSGAGISLHLAWGLLNLH